MSLSNRAKFWFYGIPYNVFAPSWASKTTDPLWSVHRNAVVMVGDSTTAYIDFGDCPAVVNQGIGGDTSTGVLRRIGPTVSPRPRRVCLGIGANDVQIGQLDASKEWFFRWQHNYTSILETIQRESPDTEICLSTPLPVDRRFEKYGTAMLSGLQLVRNVVLGFRHCGLKVVDLYSALAQEDGYVKPGLFPDLVHPSTAESQSAIKAAYGDILV